MVMATPDELIPPLKQLIVDKLFLKVDPAEMDADKPLMDTYGIDSVSLFEIVVGLEEEYGIVLADDEFDIELFRSVRSIAEFAASKLDS